MNLFLELSKLNHSLNKQVTMLKIADNKNKLAQLLLKTSIKNGKKTQSFDLQYSKSELASYLGMRIESLSRVLRQLQNDGEIVVKGSKVILNNKESLCRYCSDDIFKICSHKKGDFCKY